MKWIETLYAWLERITELAIILLYQKTLFSLLAL